MAETKPLFYFHFEYTDNGHIACKSHVDKGVTYITVGDFLFSLMHGGLLDIVLKSLVDGAKDDNTVNYVENIMERYNSNSIQLHQNLRKAAEGPAIRPSMVFPNRNIIHDKQDSVE